MKKLKHEYFAFSETKDSNSKKRKKNIIIRTKAFRAYNSIQEQQHISQ